MFQHGYIIVVSKLFVVCIYNLNLISNFFSSIKINTDTSCEGGQFFNKSSLFCEDCQPGHYSLSGGIVFDNFKSLPNSLPDGFHVKTEYRGHDNIADGLCSGKFDQLKNSDS